MTVAAVILAAGFGTRLAPLTDNTPKPLLKVGAQPVITYLVDRLRELQHLDHVVVVINDQHQAQWHDWVQSLSMPAQVSVVSNGVQTEVERRGAVADLRLGLASLHDHSSGHHDRVIVLAGDNLLDEPLQPHLDAAQASNRPVVLCRDLGDDVPPGRFGEITVDYDNIIVGFREKPADPRSPLAATCSYVLPGEIADEVDLYLVSGDADSPGSFVAWLAGRRSVEAHRLRGRYFDIGNHETLTAARQAFDG